MPRCKAELERVVDDAQRLVTLLDKRPRINAADVGEARFEFSRSVEHAIKCVDTKIREAM